MTNEITFTILTKKDKDGSYKGGILDLNIHHKDMDTLGELIDACVSDLQNLLNGSATGTGHLEGKRFNLDAAVGQTKVLLGIKVSQDRSLDSYFQLRRDERIRAEPDRGIKCGDCRRASGCPEVGEISICTEFLPHNDVICCGTCYKFTECSKNQGHTWNNPCGEYGVTEKPLEG